MNLLSFLPLKVLSMASRRAAPVLPLPWVQVAQRPRCRCWRIPLTLPAWMPSLTPQAGSSTASAQGG